MNTRTLTGTALVAATMILATSCNGDETSSPTAPSALGAAASYGDNNLPRPDHAPPHDAPQTVDATSTEAMSDIGRIGVSAYTYVEGVPGPPRNVRVKPTGNRPVVNKHQLEVDWDPPTWGSATIDYSLISIRDNSGESLVSGIAGHAPPTRVNLLPAEGRVHLALCNVEFGCSPPYDAGRIFVGGSNDTPAPPSIGTLARNANDVDIPFRGRTFRGGLYVAPVTVKSTDFVDRIRVEYWVRGARRQTTISAESEAARNSNGVALTDQSLSFLMPEGDWTFTIRTRNNRGWGRRAVRRFSVQVDGGIEPGPPINLSWNDGLISWNRPNDHGGLPLLKYEYYPQPNCPTGHGTPFPLQVADRYVLRSHEARVIWAPNLTGISVRAFNSKGAGDCASLHF